MNTIKCLCRNCRKEYIPVLSNADLRGFCTQRCVREKAKELGWKPELDPMGIMMYAFLKQAHQIGELATKPA